MDLGANLAGVWARTPVRLRRHGPALGGAVLVNLALIGAMILAERPTPLVQDTVIDATIVAVAPRPGARPRRQAGAGDRRSDAARPLDVRLPELRPAPPPEPGVPRPPAVAYDPRWTTPEPSTRDMDVRPSPWRSMRARDACAKGEFWKITTEEKERCQNLWAKYKRPDDDDPNLHHRALKDPNGDWARAAAAAEDRRKPMSGAPVHPCHDPVMPNFDIPCH